MWGATLLYINIPHPADKMATWVLKPSFWESIGSQRAQVKAAESMKQSHLSHESLIRGLEQQLVPGHLYLALWSPSRVMQQPGLFVIRCIKTNSSHNFQSLSSSCIRSCINSCTWLFLRRQCPKSCDSTGVHERVSGFQGKGESIGVERDAEVKTFSTKVIAALLNEDKYQIK